MRKRQRQPYPMPITEFANRSKALSTLATGLLTRLCLHFWETGCQPLPSTDAEVRQIVRGHESTWRKHRPAIMEAFQAIRPELEAYKAERDRKADTLRIAAWRANAGAQARAASTRLETTAPAPLATIARPLTEAAQGPPKPPQSPLSQPSPKRFAQRTR